MRWASVAMAAGLAWGCGGDDAAGNADAGSATTTTDGDGGPAGPDGGGPGGDDGDDGGPGTDSGGNPSGASFEERCGGSDVIACFGFDTVTETDPLLNDSGFSTPTFDGTTFAEGTGAIHMQVLPGSPADTSGSAVLDFSPGVGQGESIYVQWRQRFSAEFLATDFDANGFKQILLHENTSTAGCSDSEIVVTNSYNRRFPIVYHACGVFHAPTENPVDGDIYEFNYQPGGDNRCLYSWVNGDGIDFLEPTEDLGEPACFGFVPDQWITFQLAVHLGPWCTGGVYEDCPENSRFELWVSHEGQAPVKTLDWPVALITTTDPATTVYDSIQLTPYNTNKNPGQDHPAGELWYDSVIVSRSRIPQPR